MKPSLAAGLLLCFAAVGACTLEPNMPPSTPHQVAPPAPPAPKPVEVSPRAVILGPEASPIDFDRIAHFPEPGGQIPRAIGYSPDGKMLTYLQSESGSEEMALFGFDLAARTAKVLVRASDLHKEDKPLTREEELRRERQRQKIHGVTEYRWAKSANVMLLPHGGALFLRDEAGVLTKLSEASEPAIDAKLTRDGSRVAFVRHGELVALDVKTKKEEALTHGVPAGVTRGLSDFNGQEEFAEPSGFWWSPAGDKIAYLEVDERAVGTVPVMGYRGGKADLMEQRYPEAGKKNPSVKPGILDVKTKKTTWLDLATGEHYVGRFFFTPDGKGLVFQTLTRDQKHLAVVRADAATGKLTELWTVTAPTWVTYEDVRPLQRAPVLVATATVGGHVHLETRDAATGKQLAQLTRGDWDVESIAGVDEDQGLVYFVGTLDSAVERQLYAVPLAGGAVTKVTTERGVHQIFMSPSGKGFADVHSASDRMPKAVIRGADGALVGELAIPVEADLAKLALRTPKLVTVKSSQGEVLHGALLEPRTIEPGRRYPVIVMVYGGPGVQLVLDAWAPRLLWQHLADRGFVIFQLDNHGSAGRGPAFEAPIYHHLGEVELADQVAGLDWLKATLPYVDGDRVGIYGHSYGGFMAALALLKAPDRFQVGVSGSPVTDWGLYDTGYTERFMGTPEENQAGYAASDLGPMAKNLKGKLLLIHAMMDENVHFANAAHLIEALIAADKKFDLLVFPGERHGYRSPVSRRYAMKRVVDYFVDHL